MAHDKFIAAGQTFPLFFDTMTKNASKNYKENRSRFSEGVREKNMQSCVD